MSDRRFVKQSLLALSLLAALVAGPADARRGGSFGSRGSRTYAAPRSTNLTPGYVAPVTRSMTDPAAAPRYAPSTSSDYAAPRRPGLFHGFGGGLLTGLVAGGLIGHFFGHNPGWGAPGGGGLLVLILQIALIGGGIWLLMRLLTGRSGSPSFTPSAPVAPRFAGAMPYGAAPPAAEFALSRSDQETFERLLIELQDAFSHEDYARLRTITTPELMSYLAEELSDNATHGRRNEVTATQLLDGDVSEAWQEDGEDYATVALRYESIDIMRDRTSGLPLAGSSTEPTVTTEMWTFVRPSAGWGAWKVSAIQDA